jgi:hypothetical protein
MRANIITWNPINTKFSVLHSSIYIKPTLEILEFFNRSPNKKAIVQIKETGSCYDNTNIFCTIDKSSDIPNKRDNFFDSTGLYIITLHKLWYGFPPKNGYLEFQEGIVDDIVKYVNNCKENPSNKLNENKNQYTEKMALNYNNKLSDNSDNSNSDNSNSDNSNSDNSDNSNSDNSDNSNSDNDNDKTKGLDNNILYITGLSILLILVLTLSN